MKPAPESVQDVVLRACGRIDKKATLTKIVEMADQLAVRLMPPGDTIPCYPLFSASPFT